VVASPAPPILAEDERPPTRRRRRWRKWLALAVLVAVVAGAWIYVGTYQPLVSNGDGVTSPDGIRVDRIVASEGNASILKPRFRQGGVVDVYVFVSDDGRWPVTVTGVQLDPPGSSGMGRLEAWGLSLARCCGYGPVAWGRPFILRPHQQMRSLVLRYRMSNCENYGFGSSTGGGMPLLSFRVFGIPRHVQLTTEWSLTFDAPPDSGCPARPRPQ
jgi:hypothetical protein